jgi:membrane-bound metal-dependent hydrolase YbcI (DUF457 family)
MMGPSHALSGAAVWLTGSLAVQQWWGVHQSPRELALGTAVCAGGALLPDLDLSGRVTRNRGGATVARTFGVASLFVAEVVEKFSLGVYRATRTRRDPQRDNGHRTLTHTIVFNVALGAGTTALCGRFGQWAVLGVLFFTIGLALRGLFERWAERAGWVVVTLVSAAAAGYGFAGLDPGRGYPMLGFAVGIGGLVHVAGDMVTHQGCPIFWPVPLGRRTWRCVGVPNRIALDVGGRVEVLVVRGVLTVVSLLAAVALLAPGTLALFNITL